MAAKNSRSTRSSASRKPSSPSKKAPGRKKPQSALTREVLARLPKTDLHCHLDGSLRLSTLIELAAQKNVALPSTSESGLKRLVFKRAYRNLPEYLKGFEYTVACLSDPESLERAAYELCEDCEAENVRYVEIRFAPQLHVRPGFDLDAVLTAVSKGIRRAERRLNAQAKVRSGEEPEFRAGIICCAMRFFNEHFSPHYRAYFEALPLSSPTKIFALASSELARAAVLAKEKGLPVVGLDLAGQERGFPASDHREAYALVHQNFLGKTVHAGEDYGPESIFQAITDCLADRIGHGTWIFSTKMIHDKSIRDRKRYVDELVRYVAEKRITLEVCLTSNQQTIPEFRNDLSKHPFRKMRKARISATLCTDNRLVSDTTVTNEVMRAVETFGLKPRELKNQLLYGFKRSFYPGPYLEKRRWVRHVIDRMDAVFADAGVRTDEPV